jgi:hypothetical protein
MTNMSQSQEPRSTRRWAWTVRPIDTLDNPVQRWLGNRMKENRLQVKHRPQVLRRLIVRPAM